MLLVIKKSQSSPRHDNPAPDHQSLEMASADTPLRVGDINEEAGEKDIKPSKRQRRTPYIRWFGISHPELPPEGTAPTALKPMVNPVPVALGISPDNKTKHIRNPRVHLINAARIEPLDPGREAILMSLTAYTSLYYTSPLLRLYRYYYTDIPLPSITSEEPVPSYEVGKITFWFSITTPYRKDLLTQLVNLSILECTGWGMADPPALEVCLLLIGDQCSRVCCGCRNWEQLDEPEKETGKRRYKRLLRCGECLQCFFCSESCQIRRFPVFRYSNMSMYSVKYV